MQFREWPTRKSAQDFSSSPKITSMWLVLHWQKYCWAGDLKAEWVNEYWDGKAGSYTRALAAGWLASHLTFLCPFSIPDLLGLLRKCYFPHFCIVFITIVPLGNTVGRSVGIYIPPPWSCSIWTLHIWMRLTSSTTRCSVNQESVCVEQFKRG